MTGRREAPAGSAGAYPMFVDLAGRRCLVVGGGTVATDKAAKLVEHGAEVRVVSPQVTSELARMVADGRVADHRRRTYRPEDLEGCFLVIAATDREEVNLSVAQDAEARNMLCNIVDAPRLGSFIVPSTVRRGALSLAVSTGGASPVVARHVRRRLEREFGPEWGELVEIVGGLRPELKERHPGMADRRHAVELLMESDVLRLLAEGDREAALERARRVLDLGVRA